MTTQYSPNAGCPIPQTADPSSSGTWGVLQGTGIGIYDGLICAVETVNVAGSSNVVLTFSVGTVDQTCAAHFNLTGAITDDIEVLWPNGRDRMFSVTNSTTGAHTLSLGVNDGTGHAAGTTSAISQGATAQFLSDGTNVKTRGAGGITQMVQQRFAANDTYTPTPGMLFCEVWMKGSGAGGYQQSAGNYGGGGGGEGETAIGTFTAADIGASQAVTIGLGGAVSTNGNTTSLGSLLTAAGGATGTANDPRGGTGGTGGTGTGSHFQGSDGGNAALLLPSSGSGAQETGGQGGGAGGRGGTGALDAGQPGRGPGGGGGGNGTSGGTFGNAGVGHDGYMLITEYVAA